MDNDLKEMISKSTFSVEEGRYVYAKVKTAPEGNGKHFMVTRDADEVTVVTREEHLKDLDVIEKNKDTYTLIALNVAVPFYSVGFLAAVSTAVAKEGINILIVSTYSKDYILVRESDTDRVKDALKALGFKR